MTDLTSGNDTYTSISSNEVVNGLGGADRLNVGPGDTGVTLNGGDGNDILGSINQDNNFLNGGAGDDIFNLGNGAGNTLSGGTGNDVFKLFEETITSNVVVENAGEGIDTVQVAFASYTLGDNIENLDGYAYLAAGGGYAQTLTGNALNNIITAGESNISFDDTLNGMSGDDMLYGGLGNDNLDGGSGNDTLFGEEGNDKYYVDASGDVVTELANEGTDTVFSTVSYSLANNVENMTLTGSAAINATGNAANNVLTGNSGNNTLTGGGGSDTMVGGGGDDTYVTDGGDIITEQAGEGTDLVRSSITYTLVANLENLTLTGSADIDGTGNSANNVLTGNSGNNTLTGGGGIDSFAGEAGDDTYVVESGEAVTEQAGEGYDTVLTAAATYVLASEVEKLVGTSGSGQTLTGNSSANRIEGGGGQDTIDGGSGADVLVGGAGNDTYNVDSSNDSVTEIAGEGTDLVRALASFTLSANVENLTLLGSSAINGTGNTSNNTITGNSANNTLNGGGGTDVLAGGNGDDTYVTDGGDALTENAGEGTDTVVTTVGMTLATNFENITLSGTDNINAVGNSGNNVLTGNIGNNRLNGGAGNDSMAGGAGDDTYVAEAGDTITENAGEGTDTIETAELTYTLAAFVEALKGTNAAGQVLTGNGLANSISAIGGNDRLDGGVGADAMAGGDGNDIYITDNIGDTITELAGEGTDRVESSASHTLSANVEQLVLSGVGNINATGNAQNNSLTGNAGANVINGGGGIDVMTGGSGNDSYVTDGGDTIVELDLGGADRVISSISYTLATFLEHLTLSGSAAINGTGNSANNSMTGNTAANRLSGGLGADTLSGGSGNDFLIGGAGLDRMTGGLGKDVFDFNALADSAVGITLTDVITDFTTATDDIDLSTIDASTRVAGNNAFSFIKTASFSKKAGQLNYKKVDAAGTVNDYTLVSGDVTGDGVADFSIKLTGLKTLAATDFIL